MKTRELSQDPDRVTPFGSWKERQYTFKDGLAGMLIEDIYQDSRGLIWIGTADGGVSRFDGEEFENFQLSDGLPHLTVMTIAEDGDGRLWFGTLGGGLAVFDGREFEVYTTEHGLPSNEILGLRPQTDGSMRLLTGAGIGRFAGGACVECTTHIEGQPLGRVHDLVTDSTGTTWLATRTLGVVSLEGRCLSPVFAQGGPHNWAWKFAEDESGLLWIASRHRNKEAVVGRYDPRRQHLDFVDVSAPSEVEEIVVPGIRHLRLDDRGWLWMARRGVLVYDGQEWHSFSGRFPDADFRNTRLTYEDREGNIWVGSYAGGLVLCHQPCFQRFTEADGLPHRNVKCLAQDRRGRIWIGTFRGTACLEEEEIHSPNAGPQVYAMEVDRRGTLWIGDSEGTVSKGASKARVIAVGTEDDLEFIVGLCRDRTGSLWVCTSNGILGYIEKDRFVALKERLPHGCRTMMQDSEGVLWLGTADGSPPLYYKDRAHRLHAPDCAGLEAVSEVNALCEHQDLLWVGTASGLVSVDLRSGTVRRYTMDQGLPANCILSLETDRKGRLWIGTNGAGALNYNGEAFQRIHLGESSPQSQVNAILCDSQGRLWFGTGGGLTMYRSRSVPPGIVIRQEVGGRLLEAPRTVSLPKGSGKTEVHFKGIRFRIDKQPMRYSHRLVGYGPAEEWSELSPANKVAYHDLPVGDYRFEVRTTDPEGSVSEVAQIRLLVVSRPEREPAKSRDSQSHPPARTQPGMGETIARILSQLERGIETDMTVLLQGETGTGKGLIARAIHDLSPRRNHAFIPVNCGSLSAGSVETGLFGHERGAFAGAVGRRVGYMEQAHGGTLFLDGVGDLPSEGQLALLHVLENGLLTRVGGVEPVRVDVRVIAATNTDMDRMVREGTFREDLYFRLKMLPVTVPPLRDRREEIPVLAAHFAAEYANQLQRPVPELSPEAGAYLRENPWPGNVRELMNRVRRAVVLCKRDVIEVKDVSLPVEDDAGLPVTEPGPASSVELPEKGRAESTDEKQQIMEALEATNGRIYGERGAAKLLGMNPERLRSRMRVHGLRRGVNWS